ncbi:hypothetical protein AVEN_47966-1 [Araneus ventricosus]|uniref:Uncharacterized protein n=1 Tax=Araneus ventricosus TaxID=182803 RepID=A0A4Y2DS84_ARAVE|nr:hypothetical protein AVEN_47966-1 [Araneus ventricosus]
MPTPRFEPGTFGLDASALASRPSCLEDILRRQIQNNVRGDDLFMLDAFRIYSFLPLRVECDPMFHGNYCSYWLLVMVIIGTITPLNL